MNRKNKIFVDIISIIIFVIILTTLQKLFETQLINYLTRYEIFLIVLTIGIIINIPVIKILQTAEEKIFVHINEKDNFNFDIEYYREIIKKYPVATLNLCLNRKNNYKDEMVATLIALEKENKIKIENEKVIELVKDYSFSEKNLIRALNGFAIYGKKQKRFWHEDAIEDAKRVGLLNVGKAEYPIIIKIINSGSSLLWLFNYGYMIEILGFSVVAFIWSFVILLILLVQASLINYSIPFYRTEKGLELQAKLKGLKKYLKDYSVINEREISEINMWDYYIIYAILFNMQGTLDQDSTKYFNKYLKKLF